MWLSFDARGSLCVFESLKAWAFGPESGEFWFRQLGINLTVLGPGQPNGLYHAESQQEAFLVLAGGCRLLINGEERALKAWDFVHCPAGTEHVFVGAGEGLSTILMAGARSENEQLFYPAAELAAQYGGASENDTNDPRQAYAPFERPKAIRPPYWQELPWA